MARSQQKRGLGHTHRSKKPILKRDKDVKPLDPIEEKKDEKGYAISENELDEH